jgi:ABC-type transport system substrate-binding protein
MRARSVLFLFLLPIAVFFPFLPQGSVEEAVPGQPRLGGTLRIKPFIKVFKPDLDPASNAPYYVLEQLYDGLVRLDGNYNIIPALAEYWVISGDGRTCTFTLRKGARFHHGREVTSDDVKFSLERLLRKDTGVLYAQYFLSKVVGAGAFWAGKAAEVTGFRARDRYTFEIEWKDPYVSGLYLLSMPFCKVLPRDLVGSQGRDFFQKPSGTGAFRFGNWLRDPRLEITGVRLERNRDYFGEIAYLDAVEYSPAFTMEQFLRGEVQIIPLESEDLASGRYQVLENNSLDIFFLGMNCRIPPLDRKGVRQALAFALDKKKLARAVFSVESVPQVVNNYIPADLPGFFPLEGPGRPNLERAGAMLAEAGFPGGKGFPELSLCFVLPRTRQQLRLHQELKSQLAALGIGLEMRHFRTFDELRAFGKPRISFFEWRMDFPDAENIVLPLFSSGSPTNGTYMDYANPELDAFLAASEVEAGWEERTGLFRRMESILLEDVPAVPLFQLRLRMALQPYVRGAAAPLLAFHFLDVREIWIDR